MVTDKSTAMSIGLSDRQVEQSRSTHGANTLTPPKRPSIWKLYLEKFQDPIVRVLLIASVVSLGISVVENQYAETIGIISAILLATGIGFYFEYDASRKFDLLNIANGETKVKVVRNANVMEVLRKEVVVDDIVVLDTGEEIPADGILLEAVSLQVDESNLTGEPIVGKTTNPDDFDPEATYPSDMVLRGTIVMDGHGVMRVTRVGDATQIGCVARQSTEQIQQPTPLNRQLTALASWIGKCGFITAALAFGILFVKGVVLGFDFSALRTLQDWLPVFERTIQYFMMAVTLLVVVVPEGLPMSITLSLALNMRRMLSTNNLVRKMHACETMGAITVICTDKTGTLTQNKMRVSQADFYGLANGFDQGLASYLVVEGICANSTAMLEKESHGAGYRGIGNPTEAALLSWLMDQGKDYNTYRQGAVIREQLTFSTERKFMATAVSSPLTGEVLYLKGAPEIVLSKCQYVLWKGQTLPLDTHRAHIEESLLNWQRKAMRTLAFAYRPLTGQQDKSHGGLANMDNLVLLGIVAIVDPIRDDVPAAVKQCRDAGIDVKIVTGDTSGTAIEIARQIGLWNNQIDSCRNCITGVEFAALSDDQALERVMALKVMCRARPTDKQRLVRLLQQKGAVVAVTGDGTNDAPALNHAHVGLAMGTGTFVAKEAGDITLLDDSFHSIVTAVMWGRSLYKNIQRFILFQLTINFVALFIVLIGAMIGTELPLTVTQMLWINLIMDTFAAMALASTPPDQAVMSERPRKNTDFIITKPMLYNILGVGVLFLVALLGMMYCFWNSGQGMDLRQLTIFFTVFVMLQVWNLFNARVFGSMRSAFTDLKRSYGMLMVVAMIVLGQVLIVQFGGTVFRTTPLDLCTWIVIVLGSSMVLWAGELVRAWRRVEKRNV